MNTQNDGLVRCPHCGAEYKPQTTAGVCPACAFGEALSAPPAEASASTLSLKDIPVPAGQNPTAKETAANPAKTIALSIPPTEKPGDRIGRYKLLEQIGEGGCGVVYVAEQEQPVRRRVALKVIKLGMDTRQVIARFEAERQALALMDHPNIAKVLDGGATETGRPFFVMELVKGVRITDYCDRNNLSTAERLGLFVQVCHAIQHAHQKGIIHRDIKPSNILVTLHDGVPVPKVIDFGIAKTTTDQRLTDKTLYTAIEQFIGTPAYMSPEQAELSGLDVDTRCDIYALGVLLYELLTSKMPFDAQRLVAAGLDEIRRIIREEDPPRPSTRISTLDAAEQTAIAKRRHVEPPKLLGLVRGDLDWIVMKCLEKDRTRRYETANGLAMDLQRHLNDEPVVARPPGSFYRFQKLVRRNKLAVAATAAVAVSLIAGLGLFAWEFAGKSKALDRVLSAEKAARAQAERADRNAAQEAAQRQRADRNAAQEAAQRHRAEAAALEARNTLAASDFLEATRLIAEGQGPDALARLQRCLSFNPSNAAALMRLTTLLCEHTWLLPVLTLTQAVSAQFSPDGRRIVTTGGRAVQIWDAQTGQPLSKLQTDRYERYTRTRIKSAQFSPDGRLILTGSEMGGCEVWDAQTGERLARLSGVASARFSADGKRVLTVGSKRFTKDGKPMSIAGVNEARVWDAQTGQALTEPLEVHTSQYSRLTEVMPFSPDGTRILTLETDRSDPRRPAHAMRVLDTQTGKPVSEPFLVDDPGFAQFSPDGKRVLASCSLFMARLWDAQTGRPLTEPFRGIGKDAEFSLDGRWVLSGARVWDPETGKALSEAFAHAGGVSCAEFSPESARVVTGSGDGTARVWDAQTGKPISELLKSSSAIRSAQFSPDGCQILTVAPSAARVWEARRGKILRQLLAGSGGESFGSIGRSGIITNDYYVRSFGERLSAAQFSPDGKRILVVSKHEARVWDAQSCQPLTRSMVNYVATNAVAKLAAYSLTGGLRSGQFSPDGKRIVTASNDGTAQVWDAQSGEPLGAPLAHPGPVTWASFSPDGKRIVTTSGDGPAFEGYPKPVYFARVWDAQTGQPLTEPMEHRDTLTCAQFSPDGKRVVTVCRDGEARLWDAETGDALTEAVQGVAGSAEFSPDGARILLASGVWEPKAGSWQIERFIHSGGVSSAHFSPNGRCIVTASGDATARVWDAQTGQPLTEPMKHAAGLNSARFSSDGARIVTATSDGAAQVWEAQTGQPLTEPLKHPEPLDSAQFSPDGTRIVTVSPLGRAWVWDIAPAATNGPDWLLKLAEALSGQRPNPKGGMEPGQDPLELIGQVRQALQDSAESDWTRWGRWFLADRSTRAISPGSERTVPQHIEGLITEAEHSTSPSGVYLSAFYALEEAQALAVGDTNLLSRINDLRARFDLITSAIKYAGAESWKEARAAYAKLTELEPTNILYHYSLSLLLVQSADREAYQRHCEKVLERFSSTHDPMVAEQAAICCLMLPTPEANLKIISRLIEAALPLETNQMVNAWCQFTRGLAEYRQGHFASAVELMQKVLETREGPQAEANSVLAMSQRQGGNGVEALAALAKADSMIKRQPKFGWESSILPRALFDEAKSLVEHPATAPDLKRE